MSGGDGRRGERPGSDRTGEPCITCGDVAVPLTVDAVLADGARCLDDDGRDELVALDLVGPVAAGDRVLVHAGVALVRLADLTGVGTASHDPDAATDEGAP